MPKQQKILLIILVAAIGYLVYTYLIGNNQPPASNTGSFISGPPVQQTVQESQVSKPQSTPSAPSSTKPGILQKFDGKLGKDPFAREVKQKAVQKETQQETGVLTGLKLNGTLNGRRAVINNRIYNLGDSIDELKIIEIYEGYIVLLSRDGLKYTLRI